MSIDKEDLLEYLRINKPERYELIYNFILDKIIESWSFRDVTNYCREEFQIFERTVYQFYSIIRKEVFKTVEFSKEDKKHIAELQYGKLFKRLSGDIDAENIKYRDYSNLINNLIKTRERLDKIQGIENVSIDLKANVRTRDLTPEKRAERKQKLLDKLNGRVNDNTGESSKIN